MSDGQAPGDWLRERMEHRRLNTHAVAEAVGLKDQAVYYWLTGKTAPKDEAATKLAELLHIPEVEVRRRFGLWVPEETQPSPAVTMEELYVLRRQLVEAIDRIDQALGEGQRQTG